MRITKRYRRGVYGVGASASPAGDWKDFYTTGELNEVACLACGTSRSRDVAHEFGLAVARCENCGLVFTRTPLPQPQAHYTRSDTRTIGAKYEAILAGTASHPRDRNYVEHLEAIERHQPLGELLDIGCHCGFFLRKARDRGWRVTGVEPSPITAELARKRLGLHVLTGTLSDAMLEPSTFDAVTLIDVFEHVNQPSELLAQIGRVLRPSGILFVKVPNVRYVLAKYRLASRLRIRLSDMLDAREHLAYYSRSTLAAMLARSRFEVIEFRVPSPIQSGGWAKRMLRATGTAVARSLPVGADTPLATDLVVIARPARTRSTTAVL